MTALPIHRARRASVLVLVMTLLGILFVVGVAFLATMNFEADMISAEKQRAQSDGGVDAAVESVGSVIRNAVMASPGVPFGDSSLALSGSAFAEMPGVQNTFSPIEPYYVSVDPGSDNVLNSGDDVMRLSWSGYFNGKDESTGSVSPQMSGYFAIDTNLPNGAPIESNIVPIPTSPGYFSNPLGRCKGGPSDGNVCDLINTCPAPGECDMPRVADADGDGIVDSLLVDAKSMGLSDTQLADLAARVNPASNLSGKISVALRVVPHGGMVDLNDAHPTLIQNVFDFPKDTDTGQVYWPTPNQPDSNPDLGGFRHSPTQDLVAYVPAIEEPLLRRRNNIPPREFQASLLHGNPIPGATNNPDMGWMLFWPDWDNGGVTAGKFESASTKHRFTVFSASEVVPQFDPNRPYWPAMMDPATANASPLTLGWNFAGGPGVVGPSYDRRHLVTTISHDDLLARTTMVDTPGGRKDIRQAMVEANWAAFDPDDCRGLVPFEMVTYPSDLAEQQDRNTHDPRCCPADPECEPRFSMGRVQLSMQWLDEQFSYFPQSAYEPDPIKREHWKQRIEHTIHDTFLMLLYNVIGARWEDRKDCTAIADCDSGEYCRLVGGAGKCTSVAPYWDDFECTASSDCAPGDFLCDPNTRRCVDSLTGQRRNEALVSRVAASLTANLIDYVDNEVQEQTNGEVPDSPTRIALRHASFYPTCEGTGVDSQGAIVHNKPCDPITGDPCPGYCKVRAGQEIDLQPVIDQPNNEVCPDTAPYLSPSTRQCIKPIYVYGRERQPFISEVVTFANADVDPSVLEGWAVELYNPYSFGINLDVGANNYYSLYVTGPNANYPKRIRLQNGSVPSSLVGSPFFVAYNGPPGDVFGGTSTPANSAPYSNLRFENGSVIYLVRTVLFDGDTDPTDIVLDQFEVVGTNIGRYGPGWTPPPIVPPQTLRFSAQRVVKDPAQGNSLWMGVMPYFQERTTPGDASLGTWNAEDNVNVEMHPVNMDLAGSAAGSPQHTDGKFATAFPTTGSLLLIMRDANRPLSELSTVVTHLSGNQWLDSTLKYFVAGTTGASEVTILSRNQIDNGRMPIFDTGVPNPANPLEQNFAHHVAPYYAPYWDPSDPNSTAHSGGLNMLPWGQLIFDYFTALPLSNGGPYTFDCSDPDVPCKSSYMPKVDEGGLRVHGRININAAPWKVLAGLPLVPPEKLAGLPLSVRERVVAIYPDPTPTDLTKAQPIGAELAQGIVAYRDAREIPGTGNYDNGNPGVPFGTNNVTFGRGWSNPAPFFRRGTGFMSVGELANVRNINAAANARIDGGKVGIDTVLSNPALDNNKIDFVDAAALLIALGDWVSVRSHVFTVYGQIRGADDQAITDPAQRLQDTDSRAIRFQETIDRLPVLQGQPRPRRIGERTVGRYTDVNND